ncbi:hypothetical protein F0L74_05890 [Chitinophaga agrisoli]|uniref:Uncharacterized protein n=1 Tax=Chitinophaga agrisoli TaxID=2607653 RepID=A0A5B2W537_9BACT|nr:hypothetical protein [Chitinophaga agrisoli]KAA2245487.1 hypothetical protein F0L74_05890 [Chitinophaga agrisoli]
MALNKDVLGQALYNAASAFNDGEYPQIEDARKAFWKAIAEAFINHITGSGIVKVPGTGLNAGSNPVTGEATGTIQ